MKKFFQQYKNITLKLRISSVILFALVVCLAIITVYALKQRSSAQKKEADARMQLEMEHIANLLDLGSVSDSARIKQIIRSKTFYENGFVSLIARDGYCYLSREWENVNVFNKPFFQEILKERDGKSRYLYPPTDAGKWRWQYFTFNEKTNSFIVLTIFEEDFLDKPLTVTKRILLFALVFTIIVFFIVIYFTIKITIEKPLKHITDVIQNLSLGKLNKRAIYNGKDEVGQIASAINKLVDGLEDVANFAKDIENGNYSANFKPLSEDDVIGKSLIDMRISLMKAEEEDNKRKIEDEKRNWTTTGLAKFSEILRLNTDNLQVLADDIILNMVRYTNSNQGALYIINDDNPNDKYLEMIACYAWNKKKHYVNKRIDFGEDLTGQCVLDKETILLTEVPDDFVYITSGLGGENPNSIVITPLKLNDEIYGVIELASFGNFEKHVVDFIEKVGENIAATISSVKISNRTTLLLQQSQEQSEELKAQEEEMRQNMEELHATQEEMARKEAEMASQLDAINKSSAIVEVDLNEVIQKVNLNFCQLLFYHESELIGKSMHLFIPKSTALQEDYKQRWQEVVAGLATQAEVQMVTKKGDTIITQISYNPIFDEQNQVMKVMLLVTDITQRIRLIEETQFQAEQARIQQEEMQSILTEMMQKENEINNIINAIDNANALIELDLDGNIIKANDLFLKLAGYQMSEIISKPYHNFVINLPEEIEKYNQVLSKLRDGEIIKGEFRRKIKAGETWFYETYTPVRNFEDQIEKFIVIISDINERKKAEKVQQVLLNILSASTECDDLQELYKTIHENLSTIINTDNFYIARLDEATEMVSFPYFVDENDERPQPRKFKKGLTEYVFRTATPSLITEKEWRELGEKGEIQRVGTPSVQWLGVPLVTKNKKFGVMAVQSYHEHILFSEKDKEMLVFVANQIAAAMERKIDEEEARNK